MTPARRSAISPPENFGRLSAPRGNAAQINRDDNMVKILVGDAREKLRELKSASVHCVVTSPPYWGTA